MAVLQVIGYNLLLIQSPFGIKKNHGEYINLRLQGMRMDERNEGTPVNTRLKFNNSSNKS